MEFNKKLIETIFFEKIIPNTKNGSIQIFMYDEKSKSIEDFIFNINFTVDDINNEFNINIKNKQKLIDLMYEYVSILLEKNSHDKTDIENKIIKYLSFVWCNATYEDLNNPEKFLQKYIDFENNKLFENQKFTHNIYELNNSNITINISNQSNNYETPYLFNITITDGENEYYLPSISYGISNDCCYIYAIQNKKTFSNNPLYEKKIKRILYKINEGVLNSETNEYIDYKNGNDYYPENISDVSPSTILSLTCFFKCLNDKGINNIKVVPLMPIRYKNKEVYYQKLFLYKSKNIENKEEVLEQFNNEHLKIQQNLTEKLIRNFRRMSYHFENVNILSFPMELDEYMSLNVGTLDYSNNNLLNIVLENNKQLNNKIK